MHKKYELFAIFFDNQFSGCLTEKQLENKSCSMNFLTMMMVSHMPLDTNNMD